MFEHPRRRTTLFGVPEGVVGETPAGAVGVLGLPFDVGTADRIGTRLGPAHIRECADPNMRCLAESPHDAVADLPLVDFGDVALRPGRVEPSFAAIEAAVTALLEHGQVPLTLGGDGSVTLPQLRALRRVAGDFAVLHVDAHTDSTPPGAERYTTGATFSLAAEEGLVAGGITHVGVRGTEDHPGAIPEAEAQGFTVLTTAQVLERGPAATGRELAERLRDVPVYLCWDMDVFDPSAAIGVANPEWGGLSAFEGLALLRALAGIDIAIADVNTVSPPHDAAGATGSLAARVALEIAFLIDGRRRRGG
jgi:arginase family enzyme